MRVGRPFCGVMPGPLGWYYLLFGEVTLRFVLFRKVNLIYVFHVLPECFPSEV